ncbi:hypothetical protein GCM10007938_26820 [Vibrio zhanjiangensis]|uniref:Uncharacterized protein n=1 Tax=Vibrio zhanjiangensis TaxID=1046128 RepID=A0ABQ6F214_9VIBR|nr:hypothetical protein [Vibrio zhanjiangensis]GLT18900.1 hypothetical protein GCM10007938_26820 [Vibrio zhanjiangensis]
MPETLMATKLTAPQKACLFKLEQQMVRQKGFINREAFVDEQDMVFKEWQLAGYIELNEREIAHLDQTEVANLQLTHSCHMSHELWITAACLRRFYAYDL